MSNIGLTTLRITELAIDPTAPSTLYAGTGGGGVFKSTDGGRRWIAINTGLSSTFARALAIDPRTSSTLYVSVGFDGIFKSTDGGESWSAINTGLTTPFGVPGVNSLAIDPITPSTIYAGTERGVFKSTNGGESWSATGPIGRSVLVGPLAIDPVTPPTIYAGTSNKVYKSTNGGESWSAIDTGINTGPASAGVPALALVPTTPSTLYAGTSYSGLFKSTDSGSHWTAVNIGLITLAIRSLVIDPTTPSTLYVGTEPDPFAYDAFIVKLAATDALSITRINSPALVVTTGASAHWEEAIEIDPRGGFSAGRRTWPRTRSGRSEQFAVGGKGYSQSDNVWEEPKFDKERITYEN
jgi:photosystem II stability/assembly factor-like uncharacterized protein